MKLVEMTDEALEGLLENAPELRRLDLSNTQLFSFPAELVLRLELLERLMLDDNRLPSDAFPRNFGSLDSLREISIARNRLKQIPPVWFKLRQLCRINVQENAIEHVRGVEKLKRLKSIVMDHNHVTQLTRDFYSLKRLELLFASCNSIQVSRRHLWILCSMHVSTYWASSVVGRFEKVSLSPEDMQARGPATRLPDHLFRARLYQREMLTVCSLETYLMYTWETQPSKIMFLFP